MGRTASICEVPIHEERRSNQPATHVRHRQRAHFRGPARYRNARIPGSRVASTRDVWSSSSSEVRGRRAALSLMPYYYSDGARARSHRELARARGDYAPIMQSVRPSALLLVVRSDSLR